MKAEQGGTAFLRSLVVTVHQASGLPAMDSDGSSDPYCVVRLGAGRPAETRCVRNSLEPVWEEQFEFDLTGAPGEQSTLIVDVYDRDWILGIPLKPDYIGQAQCVVDELPEDGKNVTRWFPLRNLAEGIDYKEARIRLTLAIKRVAKLEDHASFWGMMSNPNDSQTMPIATDVAPDAEAALQRQKLADDQEMELLRNLFPHIRPVINNILRLLYLGVRPVLLVLLWHRRLILDWEKPGSTLLFYGIFCLAWWYESMMATLFVYMTFFIAYRVLKLRPSPAEEQAGPVHPSPPAMVEEYKLIKAQLMYRNSLADADPLLKDVDTIEKITRRAADVLQLYTDNLVFYADRRVVGATMGVTSLLAFLFLFFPFNVDDMVYYALRYATLLAFLRFLIFKPLMERHPELLPTLFGWVLPYIRKPLRRLRMWWRKTTKLRRLTKAEEWDDASKSLGGRHHMTASDWDYVCDRLGRRMHLRKGQVLEEAGSARDVLYRLRKGRLEMRASHSFVKKPSTLVHAPVTLLSANVLYGSGVLMNSIVASVNSTVNVINVVEMRQFLSQEPQLAEKFFLDLAVEIGVELKFYQDKLYRQVKAASRIKLDLEPPPSLPEETAGVPSSRKEETAARKAALEPQSPFDTGNSASPRSSSSSPGASKPSPIRPSVTHARRRPPSSPSSPPVILSNELRRTQDIFSMSVQDVSPVVAMSSKMVTFFQETFKEPVNDESLKVFESGMWTKRGWTRFPGRLFVTPTHLAFWSQVGRKTHLGSASKGAGVESWIIPLNALQSVSSHDREGHVAFCFDAAAVDRQPQGSNTSAVLSGLKHKGSKVLQMKIYCDQAKMLAELRRVIEAYTAESVSAPPPPPTISVGMVEDNSFESDDERQSAAAFKLAEQHSAGVSASDSLKEAFHVPSLGGVELTAGTLNPSLLVSGELSLDDFRLDVLTKKMVQGVERGVRKAVDVAVSAIPMMHGKDDVAAAPEGPRAILLARTNVLSNQDKARLIGLTEEDRDRTLLIFNEGDEVLQTGAHYERCLLQLTSGKCSVLAGDGTFLAHIQGEILFNTLTYIFNEPSRHTIRCDTAVEMRHLTYRHLKAVFQTHVGMGGRFNEFLCYHMINTLNLLAAREIAGDGGEAFTSATLTLV